MSLKIPKEYKSTLGVIETQKAIKEIKDYFETKLSKQLKLTRVSSPLFVLQNTGINDNLNGVESPVSFHIPYIDQNAEVVQSLAKWKRIALKKYGFEIGTGLYTDMNAIRKDEELDNLHSLYVDQWDWELIIDKSERTTEKLKEVVQNIYKVFKETEEQINKLYPQIDKILPPRISFITSQELLDKYPTMTPQQREDAITKELGAVFIMQIGSKLSNGQKHDARSPDYDDWTLNGDIIFYDKVSNRAIELSSMGIRVDEKSLLKQLEISGCNDRKELQYHKALLQGNLPYTIGGGIGQSRICMYFLRKAHIGEVQVGIWPKEMIDKCEVSKIHLL